VSKKQRLKKKAAAESQPVRIDSKPDVTRVTAAPPFAMLFACVVLLFFASGFSSLIYQVVWTRMLVLVFGATTFATSTVLAIFMGGLALGSFGAGRISDRLQRPLLWYGILEAIIGVWSLCTPFLFDAATPIYRAVWQATHAGLIELSMVRFVCTLLILIVPTTCMGATLPILSRFVTTSLDSVGNRVGTLYSVNTFGAVVGAVTTGFLILPTYGLHATIFIAAAINALLLGAVWLLNKTMVPPPVPVSEATTGEESVTNKPIPMPVKLAVGVFAVSGAIAMIYEVCWTRTLLMVVGSSTYAFTVMLSAFLIGIFVGSLVCARFIDRAKHPLLWFAIFQIMVGAATLASMRLFNYVPYWNLQISAGIKGDPTSAMFVRFLLAGSVLAPITLFLGAIFPTVVKACTTDLSRVGRSIGFLYSANTLGAIIGAFLAGFVCLPLFGAEHTLIYGAILNSILGLLLLWVAVPVTTQSRAVISIVSAVVVAPLLFLPNVWDKNILLNAQSTRRGLGLGQFGLKQIGSIEDWEGRLNQQSKVRYWADGACSNVGVVYHPGNKVTSLMTNGHIDASDGTDTPVQALVSGFPMLLRPNAKEIAVIGWGCGQTVSICTYFPFKNLDAIELEPKVIEASKFFHHINGAPEDDPRVHIQFNDGRNYLLATEKKYDMIISEPSNPWQSGVCNLFTKEYFAICKQRLKENGVLSVWMQTGEVPPSNLCGVLSSLGSEFKYCLLFTPRPGNLVAIASQEPLKIDYRSIKRVLATNPKLAEAFAKNELESASDVVAHLVVGPAGMQSLVAPFQNTDDANRLEFDVGKTYEDRLYANEDVAVLKAMGINLADSIDWEGMSQDERALATARIAEYCLKRSEMPGNAVDWCRESLAVKPTGLAYRLIAEAMMRENRMDDCLANMRKAVAVEPDNVQFRTALGATLLAMNKRAEGRDAFEKCLQIAPKDTEASFLLAATYSPDMLGMPAAKEDTKQRAVAEKVIALLGQAPDENRACSRRPNVAFLAAQAWLKLGDFDKADHYCKRYQMFVGPADADRAATLLKMISLARLGPPPDSK
jgi:spermidine synthase